jgi:hypothetical protein
MDVTASWSRVRPKMIGSGSAGAVPGSNEPAKWINAQIGQQWSAVPSGAAGTAGALPEAGSVACIEAPAANGVSCSECTCPNDTTSWTASANSASRDPNLARDRNQRIVMRLLLSGETAVGEE